MSLRAKVLAVAVGLVVSATGASAISVDVNDMRRSCMGPAKACMIKGGKHGGDALERRLVSPRKGGKYGGLPLFVRGGPYSDNGPILERRRKGGDRHFGPRADYRPIKVKHLLRDLKDGGPRYGKGKGKHRGMKKKMKMPHEPSPVPLPAAGWLLAAGLGGLALSRRRKKG